MVAPAFSTEGAIIERTNGRRLKDCEASGRPAGPAVAPDGSLMVSDDKGGFIYRIMYGK
jgi:glucose/arabinose dehydrogenase